MCTSFTAALLLDEPLECECDIETAFRSWADFQDWAVLTNEKLKMEFENDDDV